MMQSAAPEALLELTRCGCANGCSFRCKCVKNSLACTQACNCCGDEDCANPFTSAVHVTEETDDDDDTTDFEEL